MAPGGDLCCLLLGSTYLSLCFDTQCSRQMKTFHDLAEKLKMPVEDLMRQCNGKVSPCKALVRGLAKELEIDESFLNRLADEVRKDLASV